MSRETPSVSFNMKNPYERGLYEFALGQDKYFSKYVKRLIERDRTGGGTAIQATVAPAVILPEEDTVKFDKATVKAFF